MKLNQGLIKCLEVKLNLEEAQPSATFCYLQVLERIRLLGFNNLDVCSFLTDSNSLEASLFLDRDLVKEFDRGIPA